MAISVLYFCFRTVCRHTDTSYMPFSVGCTYAIFYAKKTRIWLLRIDKGLYKIPHQVHIYVCVCVHVSNGSRFVKSWIYNCAISIKHFRINNLCGLFTRGYFVPFCEARRASHCHSPQTTYSSKSTCCAISAQHWAMHVIVYAGRLTSQRSIVEIINW